MNGHHILAIWGFPKSQAYRPVSFKRRLWGCLREDSTVTLKESDDKTLVWRKPNTKMDELNLEATVKDGGGGLMVWKCMASSDVGELIFIDETMDKKYQDRDPKHMAYIVCQWIIYNTAHTLNTPPQSPDMNPIENGAILCMNSLKN